jgi:thiol-disulfide isomerase/thioredoxin
VNRSCLRVALLLALLGFVAGCGSADEPSALPADTSAPAVLAPLDGLARLDGPSFDLTSHPAGLPTVVWFWAPWCPNCRAMAPDLADLTAEHVGRVTVIGVAGRGKVDEMHDFVSDTGTEGIDHVVDDDGGAWQAFGVTSQPAFVFVTPDGEVSRLSGRQSREAMAERFDDLLGS